jgi:pyrimidine-nucleoside phosphorylase/thymidine phosphorylase
MRAVDLIRKKRDGHALDPGEIAWLVRGIASGEVADYQWSALLMAIVWRGMDDAETVALTRAMLDSGTVVDLSSIPGRKVDKHSTGGVGDKTSLILAPIAAACGVPVPMVSGRGLGHTGGTLDKLEAIPGFRIDLDLDRYKRVVRDHGLVLIGQTAEIAPADKVLYALRDATATVESIPLIAASIMSKKMAEGIDGLVLDVKIGDGAFLPRYEDAKRLAETMVAIGRGLGKKVRALITRMDQPLGVGVGNAVEVEESIACLKGQGVADLLELSIELAAEMLVLGDVAATIDDARARCEAVIADGSALERFRALIAAQGGDPAVIDDPSRLPQAPVKIDLLAPRDGFVRAIKARALGEAVMKLGAGRARVDSVIDPAVGLWLRRKVGEVVAAGDPLVTVLARREGDDLERAKTEILAAYHIGDDPPDAADLIVERL